MTRWMIEKSGTGIEKSGTGIEKSGTGIEKSGTGIEKSGTGIEKSGTGIRRSLLACAIAATVFGTTAQANPSEFGSINLTVSETGNVNVTWMFDDSVFIGFGELATDYSQVRLLEVSRGTRPEVGGAGTGVEVGGAGTGVEVGGAGTGVEVGGAGTGVEVGGAGTGAESFRITLPEGTELSMEIVMGCEVATVYVLDAAGYEVVTFDNVKVNGNSGLCAQTGIGAGTGVGSGFDLVVDPYDNRGVTELRF